MKRISDQNFEAGWPLAPHVCLRLSNLLAEQGVAEAVLFKGTSLSRCDLQQVDSLLPYDQVLQLLNNARQLYSGDALGLELGARQHHNSWGLVGWLMSCCTNLGEALSKSMRYYQVAPNWLHTDSVRDPERFTLIASFPFDVGVCGPLMVEELFASFLPGFKSLTGKAITPNMVYLSYPAPNYASYYEDYFQCPVEFDQTFNGISFANRYLQQPVLTADELTCKMAEQACEKQLQDNYQQGSYYERLRWLLLSGELDYSETSVASHFSISLRTLRRYLQEEGKTFRALIDDVRCQQAILLLQKPGYTIEDIAENLAYGDASNFRRAFKRWTGYSPRQMRHQLLNMK
jgi:AraC-like DNA-binding protein